jgi:chromosome segregation ATPase
VSDRERDDALEAMSHLAEIERLEAELKQEQSQTSWCRSEMERLAGLTPQRRIEDVNVEDLTRQQQEMEEDLQASRPRNAKRENMIRVSQNKIENSLIELSDWQEELREKEELEQTNLGMKKEAEALAREIADITEQFSAENTTMHVIQEQINNANPEKERIAEFLQTNEETIRGNASLQERHIAILRDLDEQNLPMRDLKAKYEAFARRTVELKETVGEQLTQIAELVSGLKRRT